MKLLFEIPRRYGYCRFSAINYYKHTPTHITNSFFPLENSNYGEMINGK